MPCNRKYRPTTAQIEEEDVEDDSEEEDEWRMQCRILDSVPKLPKEEY